MFIASAKEVRTLTCRGIRVLGRIIVTLELPKFDMHWRTHPKLAGRFPAEHPDDLQVLVHDGGPRITDRQPEAVWVTVTGCDGDVFTARVLNQPSQLRAIQMGQQIQFIVPSGGGYPILVTEKYLRERSSWVVHPCETCGLAELFDAPSDLIRAVFPNIPEGAVMEGFTSFCPLCRGVQALEYKDTGDLPAPSSRQTKAWWQFWK